MSSHTHETCSNCSYSVRDEARKDVMICTIPRKRIDAEGRDNTRMHKDGWCKNWTDIQLLSTEEKLNRKRRMK